jgi:nitrite reductase/ring-hydroxylating ferredoxin subunit/alkylhydroperoxidase/carboxymuconolactone decarboxylase family protein YurZ
LSEQERQKTLRGREYLTAVRPEAMGHLLAFFKKAGEHLDPKTRFLISVLKQVIQGSPKGLRQYIRRAMESGASRDEVIDTILLAYPVANLTRLDNAIDVLLDMEPPPTASGAREWRTLEMIAPPAEGACIHVEVGGRSLLITRQGGHLHALDDRCPHRGAALHTGAIADGVVTCPLHGWSFKLADGSSAGKGLGGASVVAVRETPDGKIEVKL